MRAAHALRSRQLFKRYGYYLFIVPRDDVTVGVCRMRPVHRTQLAAVPWIGCGFDQLGTADLLIALRRQFSDDQLTPIVIYQKPVAIPPHDKPAGPSSFLPANLHSFPDTLAGFQVETSELPVAADAINVTSNDYRGVDHRMQTVGIDLTLALTLPDHFSWFARQIKQH